MAFDPNLDVIYVANSTTDQVIAYDTATWKEKYRLAVGEDVGVASPLDNGMMTVSSDGRWLFLSTNQGVRVLALPVGTGVAASVIVSSFPVYVKAGVTGAFQVTAKDPAGNVAIGYTGTVLHRRGRRHAHFHRHAQQCRCAIDHRYGYRERQPRRDAKQHHCPYRGDNRDPSPESSGSGLRRHPRLALYHNSCRHGRAL